MTEQNTPEQNTVEEAETVQNTAESAEAPEQDSAEQDNGNKEAAKYRRKLRAAEGERDALAETVAALQREAAEALASKHLNKPAALWQAGTALEDVLGEDGRPDPGKVEAASRSAIDALGLAPSRAGQNYVPNIGNNPQPQAHTTFDQAFAPQH